MTSTHPRLLADKNKIENAKNWIIKFPWYRKLFERQKKGIDSFLQKRPIYVSPLKQVYQYKMYACPNHDVELIYDEMSPHEHRCPLGETEVFRGEKFDSAWAGWHHERLAEKLVWMGLLYQVFGDKKYAEAAREILVQFADNYLHYPTGNTILGPAHVFFGTLSESFWGVKMAYGYDLVFDYTGFSPADRKNIRDRLLYPLAEITQQFPESASNRQLWYNNVSAAVGFLFGDQSLIDFALRGKYGFEWQLGSALPESCLWAEGPGYHFVALRAMIYLAEMAGHNGIDLYRAEVAGRSMKKMFDAPFDIIKPNFEFPRIKDTGGGNLLDFAPYYEIGYAVYKDPKYLEALNRTTVPRGTQIVGQDSGIGKLNTPISVFCLEPNLPASNVEIYNEKSVHLKGSGLAVLRNGAGKDRRYFYLDYGIMGGEHGHPDRLQIGYFACGRNWIVDPLNETYFDPNLQTWYRQTIAHNTVVINQTSQKWANGREWFFGATSALQVASGLSEDIYPGAKLIRTVMQIGDYFIDLFDVDCPEKRIMDWPLHGFGEVKMDGVELKKEEEFFFGKPPGIPGYDRLTHIHSAKTNDSWGAIFSVREENRHLAVRGIGEESTQIFTALTPHIGDFYKQKMNDQTPLPMLMSRRFTDKTRFAHLIHAFTEKSAVTNFQCSESNKLYTVERDNGIDFIFADVPENAYWFARKEFDKIAVLSGFNVSEIRLKNILYLTSDVRLSEIECRRKDGTLDVSLPAQFSKIKIWAQGIESVNVNQDSVSWQKQGDFIVIEKTAGVGLQLKNSTLFLGLENNVQIEVWNANDFAVSEKLEISATETCEAEIRSQQNWWGGVVNLVATNKRPVQRKIFPATFGNPTEWIRNIKVPEITLKAGEKKSELVPMNVPDDIPSAKYPMDFNIDSFSFKQNFQILEPVSAEIYLPNGRKNLLCVKLKNNTNKKLNINLTLEPGSFWQIEGSAKRQIELQPLQQKSIEIPATLVQYNPENQLYPIKVKLSCGNFRTEIQRDFYVAIARFANNRPALDGSWDGWYCENPVTIDRPEQVCKLLMGNSPWNGPDDLSAKICAMYDDQFLYIGADVIDDIVVTHWDFPRMSYPWDTDSMEVVLDTRTSSGQGADPPTPGLFRQLCLPEFRNIDFNADSWLGGSAGGPILPRPNIIPDAETFFNLTEKGYAIFARIPLQSLGEITPEPGTKIGFDVAINDNDETNYRKNQHIWAGYTQNQSWWVLGAIGALIFGER